MKILSLGDRVRPGTYEVRARFSRSLFLADSAGRALFVVDRSIGPGPLHLVVARPHAFLPGATLALPRLPDAPRFDSSLPRLPSAARADLVRFLRRELPRAAPPESLASLLRPAPPSTAFRQSRDALFRQALELFAAQRDEDAARLVRGCGEGLTPSGDDFLCGWMLALRLHRRPAAARRLLLAAQGQNPISNAFLELAARGRANRPLQRLLQRPSPSRLHAVCAFGHSSGADLLCGLLLGLAPA